MSQNVGKVISAPYGTWESPIKAKVISEKSASKEDVLVDPILSTLYHIESRPEQNGRSVVVDSQSGNDLFGTEWDARTRVHEYGGAAAVVHDAFLIFSNFSDGQVYTVDVRGKSSPKKVTSNPAHRFADFAVHPRHPYLIVCILEDHTHDTPADIVNSLVVIDIRQDAFTPVALLSGADFYSSPRFNDDGSVLSWCQWNHPDMPWDGSEVFIAGVEVLVDKIVLSSEGIPITRLAGEPGTVSAVQPTWLNAQILVFSSDRSGYHNPWVSRLSRGLVDVKTPSIDTNPLLQHDEEHDFVDPSWWLGGSNIAVLDDDRILFSASKDGRHWLYVVALNGTIHEVECPYVQIVRLRRVSSCSVAFLGTKVDEARALVLCSFDDAYQPTYSIIEAHKRDLASSIDFSSVVSLPQPITLWSDPSLASSDEMDPRPIDVLFFAPRNAAYVGPAEEKPCAIVNVHGGPTSIESQGLNMQKQYFTSRGWAWIDVNYAGSSNYGRRYIERLKGNWGVIDVEDCAFAIKELASPKYSLIDPNRVVIRGGSAGGFTTLCSLCQSGPVMQVFAAGTSSYGVTDLQRLTESTHKFQSWYAQTLLGGTYADKADVYQARSPIFHAQNIKVPLLILQGSLDPIVPAAQAEAIVKVLRDQGGDVEYVVFEGEGHGWREAKNIESALQKEALFYSKVFGLRG